MCWYLEETEPLLQAARDIQAVHNEKSSQLLLLGVNLGHLGFSCRGGQSVRLFCYRQAHGRFMRWEERMMLSERFIVMGKAIK